MTFDTIPGGTVDLLLRADNPVLFLPSSTRKGPRGLPSAILIPLCWSLLGPSLSPSLTVYCSVNFTRLNELSEVVLVKQIWETDFQDGIACLTFQTQRRIGLRTVTFRRGRLRAGR